METIDAKTISAEDRRQARRHRRDRERRWEAFFLVAAVIIVFLLVLLLWRSCVASSGTFSESGSSGGSIVGVKGAPEDAATISLWLRKGATLEPVLERHGLAGTATIPLGDNTFVVTVPAGRADALVGELKRDRDLVDAGHVYMQDAAGKGARTQ